MESSFGYNMMCVMYLISEYRPIVAVVRALVQSIKDPYSNPAQEGVR